MALTAAAACVAFSAVLAAPKAVSSGAVWRGYTTVLVDAAVAEPQVLSAFAGAGLKHVISSSTEPVAVSNWVELETTTLGDVRDRLVEGDPRRDFYIRALDSWFSASANGERYRVYYLPVGASLFPKSTLERALSAFKGRYLLPDDAPGGRRSSGCGAALLAIVLLVLAAASLLEAAAPAGRTFSIRAPRLLARLSLAAPWTILAAAGMPMAAVAALWGLALVDACRWLDLPLEELRNSGSISSAWDILKREERPPLAVLLCAALSLALEPRCLPSVLLAILASALAVAAFAFAAESRPAWRSRFVPRPIAPGFAASGSSRPWLALLACAVALLWTLAAAATPANGGRAASAIILPSPVAIQGEARPSPATARARGLAGARGASVQDLGSWLAHLATQEALPLERIGQERDDPFSAVEVSRPGGTALALRFDDEWARSAYRSISPASVEGMLAAQGRAVRAESRSVGGNGRPLAPIESLRYIFLLIPLLGRIAAGLSALRGLLSNKARQEA